MNHLAHALLAECSATSVAGQFLGDFVKGRPEGRYPADLVAGIRLHRRLDAYTDAHPAVRRAVRRLPAARRRFGRVALDLAFDHFLARDWRERTPAEFAAFRARIYAALHARRDAMPAHARRVVAAMSRDDWFLAYADWAGVAAALAGMSRRLSRPNPLAECSTDLRHAAPALEADFRAFWPEAVAHARRLVAAAPRA